MNNDLLASLCLRGRYSIHLVLFKRADYDPRLATPSTVSGTSTVHENPKFSVTRI